MPRQILTFQLNVKSTNCTLLTQVNDIRQTSSLPKSQLIIGPAVMCAVASLVRILIGKYFINFTSTLIVHNSSWTSGDGIGPLYLQATEESFRNLAKQGHPVGLHWLDVARLANQTQFNDLLLPHVDTGIQGYIAILPIMIEFLRARWHATERSVLRLKDKYHLLLSGAESPLEVLALETLKLYPHHLMVSARNYPDLELWTQKFVGVEDNRVAVHLDTFYRNGSFAQNVELYPNKLLDMLGRTLTVASVTYLPYLVSYFVVPGTGDVDCIDNDQPKKNIRYTGSEAEIVKSFCVLRNCIIKVMPYGTDNWGGIYANGTSNGMIGSVYRGEAEVGIGCYYNWYNDIFETSNTIAKSAVTILGPAPSRYPPFMTNILPFSRFIWTLIIISIFVSSLVMHGIKFFLYRMKISRRQEFQHFSSYSLTVLEIMAIFYQQSFSHSRFPHFASRFFLAALFFTAITLENTYSGQLKSLLTIPLFTDPVDTITKFAATDWKWGAPAPAWVLTIVGTNISYEQTMAKKFEIRSNEELKNFTYRRDYGFGVERLNGGTYAFGNYIRDGNVQQYILSKDDLYFDWTRAFAVRGWPLMDSLNTHILWCLQHGLYNYWERMHSANFLDKKIQETLGRLSSGHMNKYPPTKLSIANISGPLMALIIGHAVATITFLVEIGCHQWKPKKTRKRNL